MNKKLLGFAISVLIIAMLIAPAMAMKGQTKQDFKLVFQGLPTGGEEKIADGNTVWKDRDFTMYEDCVFYLQIGTDGATEDLAKEYLEYEGIMNFVVHTKPEQFFTVRVVETVSIYGDVAHNENTLRGTLVITAIGDNRGGHGGNFVGFGTGEFEGAKIQGTSEPLQLVFTNPNEPYYYVQLSRTGAVMGWPT
jgi:hypothetical protein